MTLFLLCSKIFIARLFNVSLATFVTILNVKGEKVKATIIGFIDMIIWFLAVKEALNTDVESIWIALSYAGGYATGTYVGGTLSSLLIKGKISVQVILDYLPLEETEKIRNAGYAVSQIECTGKEGSKKSMLFIEVDKKKLNDLKELIKKIDKNAFIVVNETKFVENGFFN